MNGYIAKLNRSKQTRHFSRAVILPAMAKLKADMEGCIFGMKHDDIEGALRQLVDIVRRMDPDYTDAHSLPQTTDEEYEVALARAEDVLDYLDEAK